jgi:hypothetical protein
MAVSSCQLDHLRLCKINTVFHLELFEVSPKQKCRIHVLIAAFAILILLVTQKKLLVVVSKYLAFELIGSHVRNIADISLLFTGARCSVSPRLRASCPNNLSHLGNYQVALDAGLSLLTCTFRHDPVLAFVTENRQVILGIGSSKRFLIKTAQELGVFNRQMIHLDQVMSRRWILMIGGVCGRVWV